MRAKIMIALICYVTSQIFLFNIVRKGSQKEPARLPYNKKASNQESRQITDTGKTIW